VHDVELGRGAVGQALQAEEQDLLWQAAGDLPIEVPAHDEGRLRHGFGAARRDDSGGKGDEEKEVAHDG
jgi:hypothetical protein